MSYGIVISSLGSIVGAVLGYLYLPLLFLPSMSAYYILLNWVTQMSAKTYYAIVLAILVSTLVSFLACRKELKDMPAITLKPAAPKNIRHSMLEKSRMWLSLNFSTQWNVRDVLRNKARSLMGIAGVAGCTMLLLCAFGCSDCVKEIAVWQYGELVTGQYKVIFGQQVTNLEKRQYKQQYKGQLVQEGSCEFRTDSLVKKGGITILDEGNYLHFQNADGEEIILPQQNNWITMIGIVAGLILGYQFLDIMMQTMSEDNDMPTVVYLASYLYSIIGTWITSTGVNYMLSGKVKTICMVDALKGVE